MKKTLLEKIKDIVTGKKKKEAVFTKTLRSSDVGNFMSHINQKGFTALETFQGLVDASKTVDAESWLKSTSRELFKDDPQRKMEVCRQFQRGRVSSIPEEVRSAMAVYFTAYSVFLMDQETKTQIRETRKELAKNILEGRKMQQEADRAMAEAERRMVAVDKMIKRSNAAVDKILFRDEGPDR